MSKKTFRLITVLAISVLMAAGSALAVCAESYDYSDKGYYCHFNKSHKMETNFTAKTVADAVENLQPGDDVTFKVTYKNTSDKTTDWYMENTIEKTLEKTREKALKVSGIGKAENGGYSYELLHYDKNGKEDVLFNSVGKTFGSESDKAKTGREGLEEATNALENWFYIQTLKPGESGEVVLKVAFEGETEVNDYMDTDGGLNLRFAVEINEGNTTPQGRPSVKTGDYSNLFRWVAIMMAAGVLLLVLAIYSKKRDRKEAYDGKH